MKVEAVNHKLDTAVTGIETAIKREAKAVSDLYQNVIDKQQEDHEQRLERVEKHLDLPHL